MMISPEIFYEENIKGKTEKQILKIIKSLRKEIEQYKNAIENPDKSSRTIICPDEETRIWCNRLYLERAKQALAEMGYDYVPTKAEQLAEEFDKGIPDISKIIFKIGGFFEGCETRTYTIDSDHIYTYIEHLIIPQPTNFCIEKDYLWSKNEFLEGLRELHIGEWRRKYNPERFGYSYCDGTQWELEFHYSDNRKPVKFYGDNDYPYNFDRLKDLLGIGCDE